MELQVRNTYILYFTWVHQRDKVYAIFHKVHSKGAMEIKWKIQYSYANNCSYRCEILTVTAVTTIPHYAKMSSLALRMVH